MDFLRKCFKKLENNTQLWVKSSIYLVNNLSQPCHLRVTKVSKFCNAVAHLTTYGSCPSPRYRRSLLFIVLGIFGVSDETRRRRKTASYHCPQMTDLLNRREPNRPSENSRWRSNQVPPFEWIRPGGGHVIQCQKARQGPGLYSAQVSWLWRDLTATKELDEDGKATPTVYSLFTLSDVSFV
jgi:hypothetical protein